MKHKGSTMPRKARKANTSEKGNIHSKEANMSEMDNTETKEETGKTENNEKGTNFDTTQTKEEIDHIATEVEKSKDYQPRNEGLLRRWKMLIASLPSEERKKSHSRLVSDAVLGLETELRKLVEEKGVSDCSLDLVLQGLTTVKDLAIYLYRFPEGKEGEESVYLVRKKLSLEVLGGLYAKGIDVNEEIKAAVRQYPSFSSLTNTKFEELEEKLKHYPKACAALEEIRREAGDFSELSKPVLSKKAIAKKNVEEKRLKEEAKANEEKADALKQLKAEKEEAEKKKQQEKEEADKKKVKELLKEVTEMAKEESANVKEELKKKLQELDEKISLSKDWSKQDVVEPDHLTAEIEKNYSEFMKTGKAENYEKDTDVVAKASDGKATFGIYYRKFGGISKPAYMPMIVMPGKVDLLNPSNATKTGYIKLSHVESHAADTKSYNDFHHQVAFGAAAYYGLAVATTKGSWGKTGSTQKESVKKSTASTVSVIKYQMIAKKSFRIDKSDMELTLNLKKAAQDVVKGNQEERSKRAMNFLRRYGSHMPGGVQTLGGIFLFESKATSTREMDEEILMTKSAQHIDVSLSVAGLSGSFMGGLSVNTEHQSSKGTSGATSSSSEDISYEISTKVIGPKASSPDVFTKMLDYNSTWCLIDRGPPKGYIAIWELLEDLGESYKDAAKELKDAWEKDCQRQALKKMADDFDAYLQSEVNI